MRRSERESNIFRSPVILSFELCIEGQFKRPVSNASIGECVKDPPCEPASKPRQREDRVCDRDGRPAPLNNLGDRHVGGCCIFRELVGPFSESQVTLSFAEDLLAEAS